MVKTNYDKTNKGFTLVELMVSIALFTIVITIVMGAILTVIDVNRKSQTLTIAMNNLNFAMESITRTIKTSVKQDCSGLACTFTTPDKVGGDIVEYQYDDGTVKVCKQQGNCGSVNGNDFNEFLSPKIVIDDTNGFSITQVDSFRQPLFLIKISGKASITEGIESEFSLQSTVSPRKLDLDQITP